MSDINFFGMYSNSFQFLQMWFITYTGQGLHQIELQTLHGDEFLHFCYYHSGNVASSYHYFTPNISAGDFTGLRVDHISSYPRFVSFCSFL